MSNPARLHLHTSNSPLSTRASCNLTPTSLQSAMNIGRIPGPVVHPEGGSAPGLYRVKPN
ncbi:hypothetical protein [Methanobacterium aggregans]|uniref:hypothetical protein n=1 Tax=Methanobacterium aggregans TaxID=1615586 RepID=UPI001AE3B185|nr:hypothetical protein [Methanobacterium aggregans]MBP2045167.1 hypothetical protein [Methanobacterium aggregans]